MKKTILAVIALFVRMPAFAQLDHVSGREMYARPNEAFNRVSFKPGTAEMLPSSDGLLQKLKSYLLEKPEVTLMRIEGHVFESDSATNQRLSEQRAIAVVQWLIKNGISCSRLLPVGFGDTKPSITAGDKNDSRIYYINVALNGKAISNRPVDGGGVIAGDACRL